MRAEKAGPKRPAALAIRAGQVIDVVAGRSLESQTILVRGAKIEAVGADLTVPEDATVIDLSAMTVLPGLIDCHTHLADLGDSEPLEMLKRTAAATAYQAIPNARATLLAGFTTVRDVGVYRAFNDVAMRDAIAKGIIIGPRMYVAGAYITISEGAGAMTGLSPDIQLPRDLQFGVANGPWEVRQRIRELAHRGADHIKLLSTGAVLTHGSNPKSNEFTPEELHAAVEEAASFGLRVAAHAHAAEGIKRAIRAGVASVEHATLIDDEGIALAKQRGTYLDMDIYDEECIESSPGEPADFVAHDRDLGEAQRRNFTKAVRAGVKMTFGTDAGVCSHGSNGRQFAFMVKYGMTPMQAIRSATVNAADLIGHSELFGAIGAGKSADIVAVKGDPLADVRVLERIDFVMKEGTIYKHER
ncbi:MAG TPA: amidohydrolase family protein [Steroidobacteraceae bacterium]|nr:amidohydrolase family protein [Steroidobacteraceae bacterium]HUA23712.1 amidohydrolase family protein [Steroidobacteraceae bacterium]